MRHIIRFIPLFLIIALVIALPKEHINFLREKVYSNYSLLDTLISKVMFSEKKQNNRYKFNNANFKNHNSENNNGQSKTTSQQDNFSPPSKISKTFEIVKANILMYANNNLQKLLICDKGKNNGVEINDIAVYKNLFIGIVKESLNKISTIQPLNDFSIKLPVKVRSGSATLKGILAGNHLGNTIIIRWVPKTHKIEENAIVYTDEIYQDILIPKNLVIGEVVNYKRQDDFHYKLYVKSAVDLSKIDAIYIIKIGKVVRYEKQ